MFKILARVCLFEDRAPPDRIGPAPPGRTYALRGACHAGRRADASCEASASALRLAFNEPHRAHSNLATLFLKAIQGTTGRKAMPRARAHPRIRALKHVPRHPHGAIRLRDQRFHRLKAWGQAGTRGRLCKAFSSSARLKYNVDHRSAVQNAGMPARASPVVPIIGLRRESPGPGLWILSRGERQHRSFDHWICAGQSRAAPS